KAAWLLLEHVDPSIPQAGPALCLERRRKGDDAAQRFVGRRDPGAPLQRPPGQQAAAGAVRRSGPQLVRLVLLAPDGPGVVDRAVAEGSRLAGTQRLHAGAAACRRLE